MIRWLCFFVCVAACNGPAGDDAALDPDAGPGSGSADASPNTPTKITVTLSEHAPTTSNLVAAYHDGDHWQVAPAPVGDTYTFVVTSPKWSFAWGCQGTLGYELRTAVNVISFAVSERTSFAAPESCPRYLPVVKVAGTISNAPSTSSYSAAFGELSGSYTSPQTNGTVKFELSRLRGTHDLYATTYDFVSGQSSSVLKVAVSRGVVVNGNVTNAVVDFATALATTAPVDVTISGATQTMAQTILHDASGTALQLTHSWGGPPHTGRALAASQLQPGYVYERKAIGRNNCDTACEEVEVQHWTTSIVPWTVVLPAILGKVTMTASNGAMTATWPAYANAIGYSVFALQRVGEVYWSATIGAAYAGTAPAFVFPDLSKLPGWSDYVTDSSSQLTGRVTAFTSSLGATDFPHATTVPDGTTRVATWNQLFVAGN